MLWSSARVNYDFARFPTFCVVVALCRFTPFRWHGISRDKRLQCFDLNRRWSGDTNRIVLIAYFHRIPTGSQNDFRNASHIFLRLNDSANERRAAVAESFFTSTESSHYFRNNISARCNCFRTACHADSSISFRNWRWLDDVPHVPKHRNVVTRSASSLFPKLLMETRYVCFISRLHADAHLMLIFYFIISQSHISTKSQFTPRLYTDESKKTALRVNLIALCNSSNVGPLRCDWGVENAISI